MTKIYIFDYIFGIFGVAPFGSTVGCWLCAVCVLCVCVENDFPYIVFSIWNDFEKIRLWLRRNSFSSYYSACCSTYCNGKTK